jgi:hypothetical protein
MQAHRTHYKFRQSSGGEAAFHTLQPRFVRRRKTQVRRDQQAGLAGSSAAEVILVKLPPPASGL